MNTPLISTKLAAPRQRADMMSRARLLERLRVARQRKLILVTGPAGYGKSSLAGAWRMELMGQGADVAWLTLNRDDDEFAQFAAYVAKALGECGVSADALGLVQRGGGPDAGEVFAIALVNALARHGREVHLVLDDFQHIADAAILRLVEQLLEFAPASFHLCLVTRKRPPLSLARLRVSDEIGEIDVADLRFSLDETAAYLQARVGPLSRSQIRGIYTLTDGWIAALLLVALALARHPDVDEFLRLRPASLRSFNEILDGEVLARLSPVELEVLTHAAACRRFNGALCAQLSGHADAAEVLARLYQDNLFLIEIDGGDRHRWYRFHPLLRQRLLEDFLHLDQGKRGDVNLAACAWFDAHGLREEAMRHALFAGDAGRAGDLMESCARSLLYAGMFHRLIERVASLPPEATQGRLPLQLPLGWAQLMCNQNAELELTCGRIAALAPASDVHSQYELNLLRGALALAYDDSERALDAVQDASRVPAAAGPVLNGLRANILTWSLAFRGDHEGAKDAWLAARFAASDELAPPRRAIGDCFHAMSLLLQGDMALAGGVLRDAYAKAAQPDGYAEPACIVAAFLGAVLYETGQVDAAIALVGERVELIERLAPLDIPLRGLLALAQSHRALGHRNEAELVLARLEEIALANRHQRMLACGLGARVGWLLADGDSGGAAEVLRRLERLAEPYALEPLNAHSEIALLAQMGRIELDLATGAVEAALARADALLERCLPWRRMQLAAALQLRRARAWMALGDAGQASAAARAALQLGQPRGLVRTFAEAGPQIAQLLRAMLAGVGEDAVLATYMTMLLDGAAASPQGAATAGGIAAHPAAGPAAQPVARPALLDPLTEREIDIVRLLSQVLTNKKIARSLQISDQTVKWHLKNIYGKLGVVSRDEALSRCRALGLYD